MRDASPVSSLPQSSCLSDPTCSQKWLRRCRKLSLQSIYHHSLSRVSCVVCRVNTLLYQWRELNRTCRARRGCLSVSLLSSGSGQNQHTTSSMLILPYLSPPLLAAQPAALLQQTVQACATTQSHADQSSHNHHKRLLGSGSGSRTRHTRSPP